MTTNSPNQVDGDAQALIADCQAEIAELEKSLTTWGDAWIPSLQSKLKRQKVALAALTAVPRRMRQANGENSRTWVEYGGDYHRGTDFYTTPPAQVLRPVEQNSAKSSELAERAEKIVDDCNSLIRRINATEQRVSDKPSLKAMMHALDAFYADESVPEAAMMKAFKILLADVMPAAAGGQDV